MEESTKDTGELSPLTGSLIPITIMPRTIEKDGKFVLELTVAIAGSTGANILTVTAINSGTVPNALNSLSLDGAPARLTNEFANAFHLDFRANGQILAEGKVGPDKSVQFAVIGENGPMSLTIRGRAVAPPTEVID